MSFPPHEYIKHYCVTLSPFNLGLLNDFLDPYDHLFEPCLTKPLKTLICFVTQPLIAILTLILVTYQLDQHHDTASLQQRLLILRAVLEQIRETQTRRLLRVEARTLQLVQQNLYPAHLPY